MADDDEAVDAFREMIQATEHYRRIASQLLGVSALESQAISYLVARGGALGSHELSVLLGLPSATMTNLVDRLIAHGVVRRERDKDDRRRQFVVMTEDPAINNVLRLRQWLVDAVDTLPVEERSQATVILRHLASALRDRADQGLLEHGGE